jgi:hypothetical protein
MGAPDRFPASDRETGEVLFRILTLLALLMAVASIGLTQRKNPSDPQPPKTMETVIPGASETSIEQASDDLRRELFTLGIRLNVLEQNAEQRLDPTTASAEKDTKETSPTLAETAESSLPPLTRAEATELLGEANQQIKRVDLSLGWSDLLLRRLREDNPLGMSRAVYRAIDDRFTQYYEVTRAIRFEIHDIWSANPAAVGRDPRPILARLADIESEWEILDQELQEFLSPEDYRGFTRLVSMAQREQTVMSYLDRQEETESEESRP